MPNNTPSPPLPKKKIKIPCLEGEEVVTAAGTNSPK